MRWIAPFVFAAVVVGCSSPSPEKVCTPGKAEACIGPGGCSGGQQCNADGTGFGACDCGSGGGAGGGTGGGAGGGTGGGAGGGGGGDPGDGGQTDGGQGDGGQVDGGQVDGGQVDGGQTDGGQTDGGQTDGGVCDPLAAPGAQSCSAGQKCSWIQVAETPEEIGKLGCVADGTVPEGGACTQGPVGETTGFDNCLAGNVCISGVCKDICGFDNSANAACATGYVCTRYSGLFANGDDDPVAGACKASCNPVTQMITGGGMCPTGEGCYLLTSSTTTVAVCAGASSLTHGQAITGPAFANSCAPGHVPRRPGPGATTWECGALCQPADVTSTTNQSSEGGVMPYTCESKGASPPGSATAGESCRYYWSKEPFDDLSPFSNTVGHCWKHAIYQYDTDGDMTPDAPFPRCIALTTGDVVPPIGNPPHNDAEYFWCVEKPPSLLPVKMTKDLVEELPPQLGRVSGWRD